ncbi:MAG: 2OG-Fe(II) oxygenase [Lysobacteraceae bacterium]
MADTIAAAIPESANGGEMAVIETAVLQHSDAHSQAFQSAQPFRHAAIDNFLERSLCERLLADFPGFEARHALNEMGQVGGKAVRMDVRDISDAYRQLDRYLQTPEFLDYVSAITGISDLLYDPDYIGGGTHENRQGQGLDPHVDFNFHPRTHWHRRLNLIVYLNPEWEEAWGGALQLHSDPWDPATNRITSILPHFNKAVVFETTETSWHGFTKIQLPPDRAEMSRKSFAIYLYTVERPAQDTAPSHATIYVPETMPVDWEAGHTLSNDDLAELGNRFTRMRTQLHFLYEREKHFSAQLSVVEAALAEARNAQRLQMQGYAIQPDGVRGVWSDQWAGVEVTATFVPTRDMQSLSLVLWAPPQIDGQELRIKLGETLHTQLLTRGEPTTINLPLEASAGNSVSLHIDASHSWTPSADGSSADERPLAYRILTVVIEHG